MPIFMIKPIETTTHGGYSATIDGINSDSSDFITGTIHGKAGDTEVSWDHSGICRDNHPDCNLNTKSNEFIEVVEAARVFLSK